MDGGDGPLGPVADHPAPVGEKASVVLARRDLVADVDRVRAGLDARRCWVELALADADELAVVVEFVDGVVRRCHEECGPAGFSFEPPAGDRGGAHAVLGATMQPIMEVVELGDVGVAAAESEAGVAFPVVVEAVDSVEFDRVVGVDEEAEHAASADGGELHRIADEHDPPSLQVGERSEFGELRRGGHASFVDDQRRPCS